jgi:hypothetical protein
MQLKGLKNHAEAELNRLARMGQGMIDAARIERDALSSDLRIFFGSDEGAIRNLLKRQPAFNWQSHVSDLSRKITIIVENQDEVEQLNAEVKSRQIGRGDSGPR